jgi:AraC-like DNA-binding protein
LLTIYFIRPHPALSAFVDNYILSSSGEDIYSFRSYWPASNKTNIVFYLGDKPQHKAASERSPTLYGKQNCIAGASTRPNGITSFTGRFHTFIIDFKANGISRLFHIPMREFSDNIFTLDEVLGNQTVILEEQLLYAINIQQMARIADTFLISLLNKHSKNNIFSESIAAASNAINSQINSLNVKHYASNANMSVRNFQRRFKEQVGTSPKLYAKIFRFNEVLKRKIMQPGESWTSIAHECCYFDQMHLIKEFKTFTGFTPLDFFKNHHLQQVQMMPITRFTPLDFFRIRHPKQNAFEMMSRRDEKRLQANNHPAGEQLVIVSQESL